MQTHGLQVKDRKVTVFGIKKSGIAAIELLVSKGAKVFATEKESEIESSAIVWMEDIGVEFELGFHSRKSIENKDLIVISPGVNPQLPILLEARKMNIPVIGEVELAYQLSNARFLAVTGTSGKSTTVELIGAILSKHIPGVYVCGNIGVPLSRIILNNMGKKLNLVVEASSFQLETIHSFKPEIAVFLNFNADHMDRYSNLQEYFRAKTRIFENQTGDDVALLNYESPMLKDLICGSSKRLYYSHHQKLKKGFYVEDGLVNMDVDGLPCSKVPLNGYQLPGMHNLSNAVASIAATYLFLKEDFCPEKTCSALKEFKGLEHRFEKAGEFNGVVFINDSKSTKPQTTEVAIACLSQPTILILGGSDKGNDFTDLALLVANHPWIKKVIITGKTQRKIKHAFDAIGYRSYKLTPSFKSAVFESIVRSNKGDMVLLSPACASFDEFVDFEQRGRVFKQLIHDAFRQHNND